MKYSKEYLEELQEHLEKTNQAWCFDLNGKLWTRQTVAFEMLTAKSSVICEVIAAPRS